MNLRPKFKSILYEIRFYLQLSFVYEIIFNFLYCLFNISIFILNKFFVLYKSLFSLDILSYLTISECELTFQISVVFDELKLIVSNFC